MGSSDRPYQREAWLRHQYVELGKSTSEIAEEVSVTAETVRSYLNEHGVEMRSPSDYHGTSDGYKDADTLREMYVEQGMSTTAIADHFGVTFPTVLRYMEKHGIERRERWCGNGPSVSLHTRPGGYEVINSSGHTVLAHRLLAVAYHGFGALDGMHVHHRNGIPWDNRPENLEVLTPAEHRGRHSEKPRNPRYTNHQLLAAVRTVRRRSDAPKLTKTEYESVRTDSEPSHQTLRARFGTFTAAREAALSE